MEGQTRKICLQHGVPRRGYVLSTVVEAIAGPCRDVVLSLRGEFTKAPHNAASFFKVLGDDQFDRAAWLSLSAWLVACASGRFGRHPRLGESIPWFLGRELVASEREFWSELDARHGRALDEASGKSGIGALLPYILESHGPGSRLSVRRDPTTIKARATKKADGVFYTPVDVATFMAREAFKSVKRSDTVRVLDPAVGTGVFLRAALVELRAWNPSSNSFQLARKSLFGLDIDPIALDGAASVLLADTLDDALAHMPSPFAAWEALRGGLKLFDALLVDREAQPKTGGRIALGDLFPESADGFDIVLANPPYAALGARHDLSELAIRLETIAAKSQPTADLYPAFIEQMVRLTSTSASGAMVVPLSLACNTGTQFAACRSLIQQQPGAWRFAFFDRQPHALFGEDVKTRNAVLFWRREGTANSIETGPLRKWRGDDRGCMLAQIDFTPIQTSIQAGIPKLHGYNQAAAWERLRREAIHLGHLVPAWGRTTLDCVPKGLPTDLYVSPTAYNFLGVSRPTYLETGEDEVLSTHPLMRLGAASKEDASAAFAILSSRFAFWWWSVVGDGFHVNQGNLSLLPIGRAALAGPHHGQLASIGDTIWCQIRRHPIRSVNRGKASYTFSAANACSHQRQVDEILMITLGIDPSFVDELYQFTNCIAEARLLPPAKKNNEGKIEHEHQNFARDQRKKQTDQGRVARIHQDGLVDRKQGAA